MGTRGRYEETLPLIVLIFEDENSLRRVDDNRISSEGNAVLNVLPILSLPLPSFLANLGDVNECVAPESIST